MTWLRWLNAGFLILAACRALVPGLCATQLAAGDAAAYRAAHGCCSVRMAPTDDDRPGARAPQPERGPCGFCSLMQGMVDPLEHAQAPVPPFVLYRAAILIAQPQVAALPALHHGRAPPRAV